MLLSNYTVQLLKYQKVCINFAIPEMKEFEMKDLVRFFRKYKNEIYISKKGKNIFFIVLHWSIWGKFLLEKGFRKHAEAFCEIVRDLDKEVNSSVDPLTYLNNLSSAKIIKKDVKRVYKEEEEERKKRLKRYEFLKNEEIKRIQKELERKKEV